MSDQRKCSKCGAMQLALKKTSVRSTGITRRFACTACKHSVSVGTWSNVFFSAAIALLVMPAILAFHPRYTLQSVPPLFFIGMLLFVGLAGFEAWKLKQFETNHPAGS